MRSFRQFLVSLLALIIGFAPMTAALARCNHAEGSMSASVALSTHVHMAHTDDSHSMETSAHVQGKSGGCNHPNTCAAFCFAKCFQLLALTSSEPNHLQLAGIRLVPPTPRQPAGWTRAPIPPPPIA
ncbi:MAG: hypothetical protein AB7S74_11025 [Hyphomicrobium sp.]